MENRPIWESISLLRLIQKIVVYIILAFGCFIILLPFAWMLSTALKMPGQVFEYPPRWMPHPVVWQNFVESLTILPFAIFYRNTVIITGLSVIGTLASSALAAFSLSRLRFPGRDILFLIILCTLMIPFHVTIIPQFLIFRYLNWINTLKPLWVPTFFGGAFNIFLLRQFFSTIPLELDDAARIDGCSIFGIFLRMTIPLSKSALGIVAVFMFLLKWNEFLQPLVYLSSEQNFTVALGLRAFQGFYVTLWNLLMAASLVALLPCIVIFYFTQKYFIQGIVVTGLKG